MSDPAPVSSIEQAGGSPRRLYDLKIRLVSGLVLGALALIALFAGVLPFAIVVGIVAVIMSWEWGRIVRGGELDAAMFVHILAVGVASGLAAMGLAALGLMVLGIGAILVFALTFGGHALLSSLGVLYTGLSAAALIWIRSDIPFGLPAILFLLVAVAMTDTFAFLAGRLIGGPKLIPAISPKKTWSGLIGGVSAAAGAGALMAYYSGDYPMLPLTVGAALIALVSQTGDLAESSLKRAFDVKDASNLIPGHGGFMDRMDGVAAAAVMAGLIALFARPSSPAHFLLFWN